MYKIPFLLAVIFSALVFSGCGITIETGDDKETETKTTENAPAENTPAEDSGSEDSGSEDSGSDEANESPEPTTPYEGKIATELFRDEVMPRFVDKELLEENSLAYGCAPEGKEMHDENYMPLEVESEDQKYNCYIEYLGRDSTQQFTINFKSDGNYTVQSKGDSITGYEEAY